MTIDTSSIGGGQNKPVTVDRTRGDVAPAKQQETSKSGGSSADKVTFTGGAEQLQQLEAAVKSSPDVDTAKVNAIKAAIADGSFTIDAEKIATNLLKMEGDLQR